MKIYLYFLLSFCLLNPNYSQRRLNLDNYTLFWADEFNYSDTAQLYSLASQSAKWKKGFPYNDLRGAEHYPDTRSCNELASNRHLSVSNGTLKMGSFTRYNKSYVDSVFYQNQFWRSQRQSSVLTALYDSDYPCEQGQNQRLAGFAYGIFEIRAKLSPRTGDYSAFWLWGDPYQPCTNGASVYSCLPFARADTLPCPPQGFCPGVEIDVFETKNTQERWQNSPFTHFWATVQAHGWQNPPCIACATNYKFDVSAPHEDFHTYTLAWTPTAISWFIDGNEIRTQYGITPRAKLNLILNHGSYANGQSDIMELDFVRVYRPAGVDYQLRYNNYHQDSLIWDWADTTAAAFQTYIRAYAQNSYFQPNYQHQATGHNARTAANIAQSTLVEFEQNPQLIYLLANDNKQNNPFLQRLRTYPFAPTAVYTNILDTLADNADNSCAIVSQIMPQTDSFWLFYKGTNGKIWQLAANLKPETATFTHKKTATELLPSNGDYITKDNLVFCPATRSQTAFFAFRNDKKQLNLLIYNPKTNAYQLISTNIVVDNANLCVLNPQILLFSDKNGLIQRVNLPLFDTNKTLFDINLNPIPLIPTQKLRQKGDCMDKILVEPRQTAIFYPNKSQQLVKIELNSLTKTVLIAKNVTATVAIRPVFDSKDSLYEIFYIATNGKIKTLYQRKADKVILNDFIHSTLDVFTAEGDFRCGAFIQLAAQSKDIFVLNAAQRCISRYRQRKNNQLSPIFNDCYNDNSFQIGLQF